MVAPIFDKKLDVDDGSYIRLSLTKPKSLVFSQNAIHLIPMCGHSRDLRQTGLKIRYFQHIYFYHWVILSLGEEEL